MSAHDLRTVAEAARVLSAESCEIDGERYGLPAEASSGERLAALSDRLYRRLYARGGKPRRGPLDRAAERDLTLRLSAANAGAGTWERGWRIAELDGDDRLAVRRQDGPAFRTRRRKVRVAAGGEWRIGARCRVRVGKEIHDFDGFYLARGDAEEDRRPPAVVRLYWHLAPAAAVAWMAAVTSRLNAAGIPFQAKTLRVPGDYRRADAAVLYLARPRLAAARDLVAEIYREIAGGLRPAVPLFTLRLAPGLGLAEDPRGGRSFGQHRSQVAAAALWRSFEEGGDSTAARLAALVRAFREAGLDPERPYLEAGTEHGDREAYRPLNGAELGSGPRSPTRAARARAAVSGEGLLAAAITIGRDLCREALWHEDRCNWLGRAAWLEGPRASPAVASLGSDVYDGAAGVALFLAELARATGDREAHRTARGGLRGALARCRRGDVPLRGFFDGRLGVAWAALRVAGRLGDEELGRNGAALLGEVLAADAGESPLDLISGNAGAVLALLDLNRRPVPFVAPEPLLPAAVRWGEEIVAAADVDAEGRMTWATARASGEDLGPRPLAGLSHGASGMAWALLELGHRAGRDDLCRAGRAAFAYEDSLFDPERGNWPDLRDDGKTGDAPRFPVAWCHGAPGIALARLRAVAADPDHAGEHRGIAGVALATTAAALEEALRHDDADTSLCHGIGGLVAVLGYAGRVLGEPAWRDAARAALGQLVERRGPWPSGTPSGGPNPSLMLGTSGLGTCLLRAL